MFVGNSAGTTTSICGSAVGVCAAAFEPATRSDGTAARTTSPRRRGARRGTWLPRRSGAQDPPEEVLGRRDQLVAVDPALVQHRVLDGAVDGVVQERRGHQRVCD